MTVSRPKRRRAKGGGRRLRVPPWLAAASGPAAVALLVLTAYAPAWDNTFVYWDDHLYVLANDLLRPAETRVADVFSRVTLNNYHPLTILSWRWNASECEACFFTYAARPFVLGNVLLHVFNSLLVFLLTYRLGGRSVFVGSFSAVAFGLHPMHVESVAWISQRKDVLHVFFLLCGLISYDRFLDERYAKARRHGWTWLAATFGLFILACLSKGTAVVFPLLMLLLDFWRNPTGSAGRALRETVAPRKIGEAAPFFAVSLLVGWMVLDLQGGGDFHGLLEQPGAAPVASAITDFDVFPLLQRIRFASYGFCMYLVKLVVPAGLSPWHPYPSAYESEHSPGFWLAPVAALGILAGAVVSMRRGKLLAFGVGFYLAALAPTLQLVTVGVAIIAERYTYLAYVGPTFAIAVSLSRWAERRPRARRAWIYALASLLTGVWLVQTREQVDVWQDSEALWTRVIAQYPDQGWAYETRADYYAAMALYWGGEGDDPARALAYSRKADADRAALRKLQRLRE